MRSGDTTPCGPPLNQNFRPICAPPARPGLRGRPRVAPLSRLGPMKYRLFALLLLLVPVFLQAEEDPARAELRKLGEGLLAALNHADVEPQLGVLHRNVVVTWPDAEVSRGPAA